MDDSSDTDLARSRSYHAAIMRAIALSIGGEDKPLVLKGGTALMLCYGLDRFSEDLDFDLEKPLNTHMNVDSICRDALGRYLTNDAKGVQLTECRELKKTDTTHRCRAQFSTPDQSQAISIKIEISGRSVDSDITPDKRDGIKVYPVDEIARQKLNAAGGFGDNPNPRVAARDLHDLTFMAQQWGHELTDHTNEALREFFSDTALLAEQYQEAFKTDLLLTPATLYTDLERIEHWIDEYDARQRGGIGPQP